MTLTAHQLTHMIARPLGLAADPAYRGAREAARAAGHLDGSGHRAVYALTGREKAEAILVACATGSGLTADASAFCATVRASGLADCLANLIELAETGEREHLDDSAFTIDGEGRALWTYVAARDAASILIDATTFGGKPVGRTYTLDGAALTEALAV